VAGRRPTIRPAELLSGLVTLRYVVLGVILALLLTLHPWNDWHYYQQGAQTLFSGDGLHLYAKYPRIQLGPLVLTVARLAMFAGPHAQTVVVLASTVAVLPVLWWIERMAGSQRRLLILMGGLAVVYTWSQASIHGQFGDCMLLTLVVAAVWAVRRGGGTLAGVAIGLAVATKPWAIPMIPMLFALPRKSRFTALAWAIGISLAAYLPFLVADPSTLRASAPQMLSDGGSLVRLVTPTWAGWVRPAQLVVGTALAAVAVRRGRWLSVLAVATAARMALDPSTLPYYAAGPVLGALLWDTVSGWPAVATALAALPAFLSQQRAWDVAPRLALLTALVVWLLVFSPARVAGTESMTLPEAVAA
jgi:hypothetical protein